MKLVQGESERARHSDVILRGNGLKFKLITDWAKIPPHLQGIHLSGGDCDANDNVIVGARSREYPIIIFDSSGKVIRTLGKGLLSYTHSVRVTPWNTLLCADSSLTAHVVRELTTNGEFIRDFGEFGKPSNTGYISSAFIKAQREGRLPVWEPWTDKAEFYLSLDTIKFAGAPCNRPTNAAVSENDEIYISDGYGNCAVHKFDRKGNLIETWGAPGRHPGQFRCPHAIWLDDKGRVFVCDRENARVQVFTEGGEPLAVVKGLMTTGSVWSDKRYIYIGEFGGITILYPDLEIASQFGFEGLNLRCHGLCGNSKSELFIMTQGYLYKMIFI